MLQWNFKKHRLLKSALGRKTTVITFILMGVIFAVVFSVLFTKTDIALSQSVADSNSELQTGVKIIEEPLGLPATDIRLIIARIIRTALGLLGIVLVVIIMYAGFLWMTAGGNEEQILKGKKMIINAAIGLAIILSAYAIVSFVMKALGVSSGRGTPSGSLIGPQSQNFQGSGALGKVIKDHYPMRDQKGVKRNSKIIITFTKPILVNSFVEDTNGDGVFGNCINNTGAEINWKVDCDQVIMDDDHVNIFKLSTNVSGEITKDSINTIGASVNASYIDGKVNTIVIRPNDYLGSDTEEISYLVRLGKNILSDDDANGNPTVFENRILGNDFYEWQYTYGTELDTAPPKVTSVYPSNTAQAPKNTIIQINFSEPMDPVGIQGTFSNAGDYYVLQGNNLFLKTGQSSLPVGKFELVNNYSTLEFTSTLECGQNVCGGQIYCLPVCDLSGSNCQSDSFSILLKSALTNGSDTFEARPFTGFMDVSGNALDGNGDGVVDKSDNTGSVFDDWKNPDNYYWNFTVNDSIDNTAPYIISVQPGIDAENVAPDQPWKMVFSKYMRASSLYDVVITENSGQDVPIQDVPIWKVPRITYNDDGTTLVDMLHGQFLDGIDIFYLPQITSDLVDINYNCFYPGQGPKESLLNTGNFESGGCQEDGTNCCEVDDVSPNKAFCCNGVVDSDRQTIDDCVQYLSPN